MRTTVRTIIFGQVFFYSGLVVCVLLRPAGLGANDGISYYGVYRDTIFPYAVGLLGAAYFAVRMIDKLPADENALRLSFKLYAPLIAGIVITPISAGRWMDYLHHACGAALFSLQLLLSGYLVWRLRYVWWSILVSLLELAGGILSFIYLAPSHGFLLQSQVLFQLAFAALLILSLQKLDIT